MINVYDVVVIGGGPCGIAAVVEAKRKGVAKVLLLEKGDNHSQTIRQFYKDKKRVDKEYKGMDSETKGTISFETGTKESVLDYFDSLLDHGDIDIYFNSEVEKVEKKDGEPFYITTASSGFRAHNVIISIGRMGKPNKPSYKIPPSITQRVNFNLDKCSVNEKVLVVGGGNSAAEYALSLCKTNTVTLCYRKESFTRLNEINEEDIKKEARNGDIILRLGLDIEALENESGKVLVKFTNGMELVYDRIIYAIGGTSPVDFLKKCGVEFDENGVPFVDEKCETSTKGLFVGGDLITRNGGSIVVAFNHAHTIVENLHL
ncbi:NAD(P)-binding domain-containing protein [Campylobacter sp. VBCF_05 NA6]|uniref:NAD(P)-binding domain-containing protein n=1 Tax=unclassified Campylobacter TaxID=2593542 RepID=UPI0022E9C17C|nr:MULTISPECIES: NAD(P)-binding domain-containing protein [unclassified Campylobacter]MDA3057841.1 NAD(P)-binding domain-containing protein [Campylobacter sp. VBCF_04 NA7]MDA3058785.1 NAD(P)-binding domain-containing protein [Campylobacter sp. VBCF_05 NA6]